MLWNRVIRPAVGWALPQGSMTKGALPIAIVVILLIVWAVIFVTTSRQSTEFSPRPRRSGLPSYEKHYVTPQQLIAAGKMSSRHFGSITLMAHDGRQREWSDLAGGQPVVIVFIKQGCPCNIDLEPFFHRLYQAYQGFVRFVGVIDGDLETAHSYAAANRVPYLVLADHDQVLISRFRVENGAYVALMTPTGVLDTLWPGCSVEMMRDLSRRIAALAEVEEQPVATSGLPVVLTTGCPFAR